MKWTDNVNEPSGRHPSTEHMLKMLEPNINLPVHLFNIAEDCQVLAIKMCDLEDGPELTAGLRKLLEAKDCFVRAAVFGKTVDYRDR